MMRILTLFTACCCSLFLHAQQFGGFRPSTRWYQINTDTARVIYEAPATEQAQRVATLVHAMAAGSPATLGTALKKINIVLHGNTTQANGYVALGPFRSEYYLQPGSDLFRQGTIPFAEQLAIHEYRHVQQYNNMNRGLARVFRLVLGQEGQALANAIAIPNWFFEGDAVYAESAFTPQGRGRLPFFTSGPVSIWEAGRKYTLMKWLNGSLRDYVPNHYQFGYLLTNYGYERYGADLWEKVIADASAFRRLPTPFRSALRQHTGLRFRAFTDSAFAHYQRQWVVSPAPLPRALVTQQHFPLPAGKDSLLYLEQSYRQLTRIMLRDAQGTRPVRLRRLSSEDWLSYRMGMVAYTAYSTDPRWNLTDYSDIVLLNLATRREKVLTHRKRYYTPDLAPSGQRLVAVHIDSAAHTTLDILDAASGKVLQTLDIGAGTFFFHPRFIDEDNIAVVHRRRNGTMALHRWHLPSATNTRLLYAGTNTLGHLSVSGNQLLFSASSAGSDDVYAYDLQTAALQQLTEVPTGAYYPSLQGDTLWYARFTANGLRLEQQALRGKPVTEALLAGKTERFDVAGDTVNVLQAPARTFTQSPYRKSTGLLNPHSWRPYYEEPEFTLSAYSNNILNTLDAAATYTYNQNERSHAIGATVAYGGLFPVVTGSAHYTFNRNVLTQSGLRQYRQLEAAGGYYIPLNLSRGRTYKFFRAGQQLVYNRLVPQQKGIPAATRNTTYLYNFLNFGQYLPQARQHIFPKLGYTLNGTYRHQLGGAAAQRLLQAQLFLPSFGNHSLVLTGAVQHTDTGGIVFTNRFTNARGYADRYFRRMWRSSVNYHFPISYPDRGVGGLLYLMRLRGNLYYDHTQVSSPGRLVRRYQRSTGAELFGDIKLLNQLETAVGLRYSYLLDQGFGGGSRHVFSIIIPTDLIPRAPSHH